MTARSTAILIAATLGVIAWATPVAADPEHARVTRYDNVHIRVADPAKAVEWYVKHLGARSDGSNGRVHFGDTVLKTVIPRSVKVSEAPGFGQTVLTYDPGSRGAMSYLDAAREIAEFGAEMGSA